jgi:hypothetical protein
MQFQLPPYPYPAYLVPPPLPLWPKLRKARTLSGWKGWVKVSDDYVHPSDRLVTSVPYYKTRTRYGGARSSAPVSSISRSNTISWSNAISRSNAPVSSVSDDHTGSACSEASFVSDDDHIPPSMSSVTSMSRSISPTQAIRSRRVKRSANGWKGWTPVPADYIHPTEKLVTSVVVLGSRTRSGRS